MEICHHLIKKEQIVGIGPFMKIFDNDAAMHALYAPVKYFFLVHLKTISIKIESDWFYTTGIPDEKKEENKNLYNDFRNGYIAARKTIEELVA